MSFNKAKALKTASKYVQQGKYQSAIEEYRQIAQSDPSDVTTLNTLGDLYVKVGQTGEAIASFMHIAEHYRVSGFYLKSIAMLKKVSKLDTGNIDVSLKLAGLYAQQKLIVDARHQYLSVAEHYIREGQSQQALEIYQKIADLDPENTAVQIKLAEAFLRENQNDKAYDTFVLAAGEMRRQNKDADALQTYLRAIKAQPRGQAALASAISLYLEREESQEAIELIESLLVDKPNDSELLTLLARIYQTTQNLEAAETAIDKMLYGARARYQYAVDLGQAYVQRRDVTGALRVFDRAVEILYEYREEEKAAQLLRDILAIESQHLGALTRLAAVYERTHDDHLLVETLNLLTDAAIHVGSEPAAVNALKRLLELEPDEIQHRRRLRQLVGEDLERPAESAGAGSYENHRSPSDETDFWGSSDGEAASFDNSQTEVSTGSSSIPTSEVTVVAAEEGDSDAWGTWAADTASPEQHRASQETAKSNSANTAFFEPTIVNDTPSAISVEAFEVTEVSPGIANLRDELESVDFYLYQGMLDVARYTLESIATQFPNAPEVKEKLAQLQEAEAKAGQAVLIAEPQVEVVEALPLEMGSAAETSAQDIQTSTLNKPEEVIAHHPFTFQDVEAGYIAKPGTSFDSTTENATIFLVHPHESPQDGQPVYAVPTTAEAPATLAAEPRSQTVLPSSQASNDSFDLFEGDEMGDLLDFLDEFKAESAQHHPQEDFETHYNLGLAYKEMDMFEEAIEEFQQAFKAIMTDPAHTDYVSCCSMLAFCFTQKGLPRLAVVWLKKGLDAAIRNEDVYQALRYDLANAYAAMGELKDAYETFAEIYAIDVQYRGVKTRMQEIAMQMGK